MSIFASTVRTCPTKGSLKEHMRKDCDGRQSYYDHPSICTLPKLQNYNLPDHKWNDLSQLDSLATEENQSLQNVMVGTENLSLEMQLTAGGPSPDIETYDMLINPAYMRNSRGPNVGSNARTRANGLGVKLDGLVTMRSSSIQQCSRPGPSSMKGAGERHPDNGAADLCIEPFSFSTERMKPLKHFKSRTRTILPNTQDDAKGEVYIRDQYSIAGKITNGQPHYSRDGFCSDVVQGPYTHYKDSLPWRNSAPCRSLIPKARYLVPSTNVQDPTGPSQSHHQQKDDKGGRRGFGVAPDEYFSFPSMEHDLSYRCTFRKPRIRNSVFSESLPSPTNYASLSRIRIDSAYHPESQELSSAQVQDNERQGCSVSGSSRENGSHVPSRKIPLTSITSAKQSFTSVRSRLSHLSPPPSPAEQPRIASYDGPTEVNQDRLSGRDTIHLLQRTVAKLQGEIANLNGAGNSAYNPSTIEDLNASVVEMQKGLMSLREDAASMGKSLSTFDAPSAFDRSGLLKLVEVSDQRLQEVEETLRSQALSDKTTNAAVNFDGAPVRLGSDVDSRDFVDGGSAAPKISKDPKTSKAAKSRSQWLSRFKRAGKAVGRKLSSKAPAAPSRHSSLRDSKDSSSLKCDENIWDGIFSVEALLQKGEVSLQKSKSKPKRKGSEKKKSRQEKRQVTISSTRKVHRNASTTGIRQMSSSIHTSATPLRPRVNEGEEEEGNRAVLHEIRAMAEDIFSTLRTKLKGRPAKRSDKSDSNKNKKDHHYRGRPTKGGGGKRRRRVSPSAALPVGAERGRTRTVKRQRPVPVPVPVRWDYVMGPWE